MDITLSQITGLASSPECAPLKQTKYWHVDVRLFSYSMLETLHAELEQRNGLSAADSCLRILVANATCDFIMGHIDNPQMLHFERPIRSVDRVTALRVLNNGLTDMERSAIMFSLIEHSHLHRTILLTWVNLELKKFNPAARSILQSTPIYLNCSLVFWKITSEDNQPRPLTDLCLRLTEASNMSWKRFAECVYDLEIKFTK